MICEAGNSVSGVRVVPLIMNSGKASNLDFRSLASVHPSFRFLSHRPWSDQPLKGSTPVEG